ncbi:MAG: glutamate racemase [Candidatus Krumholzibacteriota bacterium]|nr:glutamate racemase [Candidatus Krumholzibacteriota bacterium]
MKTSDQPIGVFDSGIGGLTVLRELLARLPDESYVYFGDTARVPYGTKSAETVLRFSREIVQLLLERDVKMVVVACNTASAEAVPVLQKEFKVPIVGVIEPGVRAAIAATARGKIGVIGTAGTVRSDAYRNSILLHMPEAEVRSQACPLFVPLAEEGWIDGPVAREVARTYLSVYDGTGIDTLVLGCTHYPLLKSVIGKVMGEAVSLVDSAVETALQVEEILDAQDLRGGNSGTFQIILSDTSPTFNEVAERFLGRKIPEIELISV